jgi:hypothetical protein
MSENASVKALEARTARVERDGLSIVTFPAHVARGVLGYIAMLEEDNRNLKLLAEDAPFRVDDIVKEPGEDEASGVVVRVQEGRNGAEYIVKLYRPSPYTTHITYFPGELELVERPQ